MYVTKEFYLHRKIYNTEFFLVIGNWKSKFPRHSKFADSNVDINIIICIYKLPWRKNRNKYFNCEICEKRFSSDRYKAQHVGEFEEAFEKHS